MKHVTGVKLETYQVASMIPRMLYDVGSRQQCCACTEQDHMVSVFRYSDQEHPQDVKIVEGTPWAPNKHLLNIHFTCKSMCIRKKMRARLLDDLIGYPYEFVDHLRSSR